MSNPYTVHSQAGGITWPAARDRCAAVGQQLAIVRNANDQASLVAALDAAPQFSPPVAWIGASDSYEEGIWKWVDGTTVDWFTWGMAQPEDTGNEDCIALFRDVHTTPLYSHLGGGANAVATQVQQWRWADYGCWRGYGGFVCSPSSPPHPPSSPLPPAPPPLPPYPPPPPHRPGATTTFVLSLSMTNPDPGSMRWDDARTHCASLGMQLAIIRTPQDHAALERLAWATGAHGHHLPMLWIGARGRVSGGSVTWEWLDGTPAAPSRWSPGRPGPANQQANNLCVETYALSNRSYVWNHGWCDGPRKFACSSMPPPPAPPAIPAPPFPPPSPPSPPRGMPTGGSGSGGGSSSGGSSGGSGATLQEGEAPSSNDGGGLPIFSLILFATAGGLIALLLASGVVYFICQRMRPRRSAAVRSSTGEPDNTPNYAAPTGPLPEFVIVNPGGEHAAAVEMTSLTAQKAGVKL